MKVSLEPGDIRLLRRALRSFVASQERPVMVAEAIRLRRSLGDRITPTINRCRYCGCTPNRACPGGCAWADVHSSVCTSPNCVQSAREEGVPLAYIGDTILQIQSFTRAATKAFGGRRRG